MFLYENVVYNNVTRNNQENKMFLTLYCTIKNKTESEIKIRIRKSHYIKEKLCPQSLS